MYSAIRKNAERYLTSGDDDKAMSEDAQFWFRRIFTNLLIGNAAALVSLGAFLTSSDSPMAEVASLVFPAFVAFSVGLVFSGLTPFTLWGRILFQKPRERTALDVSDLKEMKDSEKLPQSLGYSHPIFWSAIHLIVRYIGFGMAVISAISFCIGLFLVLFGISGLQTN
ncbi:hypothetical protein [Hyphobacterium marinum]|uniref:Sensor domain-containing protein n=1 Tax=Hyphobacterium marinum TaxID=3116574 RepID=A0ABU7LWN9_9PROT|nr:hypothetical protein [Hyphobacterium sp. Y6023]MEE2565984.1 hypothetical protein [Hyphobacterium sp. Y6023]